MKKIAKTVVISGGTGLLGMRLSYLLTKLGYEVRHLSRSENLKAIYPAYTWDLTKKIINPLAFQGADAVVHLAGANLAEGRWTAVRKKELIDSRVESTKLLAEAIGNQAVKPSVFVACSAVGFYGSQGTKILTENSPKGNDFMSDICEQWEQSSELVRQQGIRTPIIRVGVVLSSQGGALYEFKRTYPFRLGAYFGFGQQYYSWIHIDDICKIFIRAIEDASMTGIYNGAAPTPITTKELAQAISKAYHQKTLLLPVPTPLLKLGMGEMSDIVLNSTRAIPKALQDLNFQFEHPELVGAIEDLIKKEMGLPT